MCDVCDEEDVIYSNQRQDLRQKIASLEDRKLLKKATSLRLLKRDTFLRVYTSRLLALQTIKKRC